MRALSLTQPWAWSMMFGPKEIENRRWPAPAGVIGTDIALHASMKYDQRGEEFLLEKGVLVPPKARLAKGALIGVVTVASCVERAKWELMDDAGKRRLVPEGQWGYFFGDFGFLFTNRRPITPIPYPGSLSFFSITEAAQREITTRLGMPADYMPTLIAPQQTMPWEPPGGLHSAPRRRSRGRR